MTVTRGSNTTVTDRPAPTRRSSIRFHLCRGFGASVAGRTARRQAHVFAPGGLLSGSNVPEHRLPLYKLSDMETYFSGRSVPDPALLAKMRENGVTCHVKGAGGWLLLCERPDPLPTTRSSPG